MGNRDKDFKIKLTSETLLESMGEGVVIINKDGIIKYFNPQAEKLFKYSPNEVVGKPLEILMDTEASKHHKDHIKKYFKRPRIRPMGQAFDLMGKKKNGKLFPVEIGISFIKSDSDLLGIAFITDITIRKFAEKELLLRNEQLDDFAETIAHDLNGMVNNICGFSKLLLEYQESTSKEETNKILKSIYDSGVKMSSIIKELLLFSRVKKDELELSELNMKQIVDDAINRLEPLIREKNAIINLNDPFPRSKGYAPWVEEVWYNLISNSLKYGGTHPTIEIGSINSSNDSVEFYIQDNGNGIEKKYVKYLFQENNKEKNQLIKGHGLGLPIVNKILEKMNGTIKIESEKGKGFRVIFTLPK